MTIKETTWTISSTDKKQHGKKEKTFSFSATSNYSIKDKDLIDLFITVGQGITYWGEAYINFRPNKAYETGFLKIEREGGLYINTNKFDLDSKIFCLDNFNKYSGVIPVSICPADSDNDGVIDNLDLDLDNDGILNSVESCDPRINESFSVKSNNGFPALHNTKSETLSINGVGLYSIKIESLVAHSSPKTISTE